MSAHERQVLAGIEDRLNTLQRFMRESAIPAADASAETWFGYLDTLKGNVGNFHQWLSFVSCLLAKRYLLEHHEMWPFDVGIKPQGASGLDFDAETAAGARVIAEIKTTVPYLVTKLGSAQRTSVLRDIDKLQRTPAEHKYLFVTNDAAAQAIETGFPGQLGGIELVCLIEGAS